MDIIILQVLEGKPQYIEMGGNLVPVTKSGEQLYVNFHAFRENRLPFVVRIRDCNQDPVGRIAFMKEPRVARGEPPQQPICNLNITLPDFVKVRDGVFVSVCACVRVNMHMHSCKIFRFLQ